MSRRLFVSSLAIAGLLVAAACAPAAPTAPAQAPKQPAPPAEAKPVEAPAPKVQPKAAPEKPAEQPPEPSEWEQTVEAARAEGTVAVAGPAGGEVQEALTRPFQERYGIAVEYIGVSNRDLVPRLEAERSAGQFLWDVRVGGAIDRGLKPLGAIVPIEPALILPEVTDPANWRGGAIEFLDDERTIIMMTPFHGGTIFVNPNNVNPEEITSYHDLLRPEWKGQIVIDDPRASGPGQGTFTFFYQHPDLGPDFIRALAAQEPVLLRDYAQEIDMVARGDYQVLVGTADFVVEQRMEQGVPITIVDPTQLREGADMRVANGTVALFDRPPHPNAARVYINWLLTQEGQTAFARAAGYVSARLDVPTDHALPWRIPEPGAIPIQGQAADEAREAMMPLIRELFGE